MEFYEDVENNRDVIQKCIKQFGYAPEHNVDWWIDYASPEQKPVFVSWDDSSGLFTHKSGEDWNLFSEPLMANNNCGKQIAEFLEFALSQDGIHKATIEARENTKKQIISNLPVSLAIKEDPVNDYELVWPVMNIEKFDTRLNGRHFKTLRNAKSKFYREHLVRMVEARDVSLEDLHRLVKRWFEVLKTKAIEIILDYPYYNLIDNKFFGTKDARVMLVDDNIVGVNGGWEIPNSDIFYASVGIHDYSLPDLGAMLYLEDLEWIKNNGYRTADMGGVEAGSPLNFKNQFLPESWYKTFVFSITRK